MSTALTLAPQSAAGSVSAGRRRHYWETLGTDLRAAMSYDDALAAAGLDWGLIVTEMSPKAALAINGDLVNAVAADRRFVLRDDTNLILGMVGSIYTGVDNRSAFSVTEHLHRMGAVWVAGGETDSGRTAFMLMRPLGSVVTVTDRQGRTDQINVDVQIGAGHGGAASLTYEIRATRAVQATSLAVSSSSFPGIDPSITVRHTSSAPDRVKDAKTIMARSARYVLGFTQIAQKLVATPAGRVEVLRVIDAMFPKPKRELVDAADDLGVLRADRRAASRTKRWTARREEIVARFLAQEFAPGTGYAAFVSIAEYLEWGAPCKGDRAAAAAKRAFLDKSRDLRSKALSVLLNPAALY